jgi:hypothetical protein
MDALSGGFLRTTRLLTVAIACIAIPGVASAVCTGPPITFNQYGCSRSSLYCYLLSPGVATPQSMVGSFWALGFGDPALEFGTDNGSLNDEDGWIIPYSGSHRMIAGDWSQSNGIDGCIDGKIAPGQNAEVMVVSLSDRSTFFDSSFFAVAATSRHPSSEPQFNFGGSLGEDIGLAPIPKPYIASSAQVGPRSIRIDVGGPTPSQLGAGFYSDGSADLQDVITGFRVFSHPFPVRGPVPDVRRETGWTPLSGVVPIGQIATVILDCTQYYNALALSLVFDSGFESAYLSPRSTTIKCGMCIPGTDADGDGWPAELLCGRQDCDDADAHTYPGANEINDGKDNHCPGDPGLGIVDEIDGPFGFNTPADRTKLSWPAQGGATSYEVARSTDPSFVIGCTSFSASATSVTDNDIPPPHTGFYYLVRPTAPHVGSWGKDSAGLERSTSCP